MTTSARPYTFDRVVRLLISVAAVAAAVWFIDMLKDVLLPFLVSCLKIGRASCRERVCLYV